MVTFEIDVEVGEDMDAIDIANRLIGSENLEIKGVRQVDRTSSLQEINDAKETLNTAFASLSKAMTAIALREKELLS